MADRIIRDIRYYESNIKEIDGNFFPGDLGKLCNPTTDTTYIGQRIARKLNELKFAYAGFDHIYINFNAALNENEFVISKRHLDKRIKYIDYGILPATYNALNDVDKDVFIKSATFKILKHISGTNNDNTKRVDEVERLIAKFDTEIRIHYKTKETNNYKIDISYQIGPINSTTRAIVEYLDKKDNFKSQGFITLQSYEDIYSLVDGIILKDDVLILSPKTSYSAELSNSRYKTPIRLPISEFERI